MLWRQTMLSQSILYSSSHKTLSMTHIDLFTHINVEGDFSDVSRGVNNDMNCFLIKIIINFYLLS